MTFSIATRQKTDSLFTGARALAAGATFAAAAAEVAGYAVVTLLASSDRAFTVRVEQACDCDGPFAPTASFPSAPDPATGLQVVCERIQPCGTHMRLFVDNTSGLAMSSLEVCAEGTPHGAAAGAQGAQGAAGAQGAQGAAGAQGAQGAQGAAATANVSETIEWAPDPATNPSTVFSNQVKTFELTDGTTKGVVMELVLPRNTDLAVNPDVVIPFVVLTPGAADGNVRMRLTCRYIADGELTTKAADETLLQTVAVVNAANRMHTMTFTLSAALLAALDKLSLHLERFGADALDTFTGTIGIVEEARLDFRRS